MRGRRSEFGSYLELFALELTLKRLGVRDAPLSGQLCRVGARGSGCAPDAADSGSAPGSARLVLGLRRLGSASKLSARSGGEGAELRCTASRVAPTGGFAGLGAHSPVSSRLGPRWRVASCVSHVRASNGRSTPEDRIRMLPSLAAANLALWRVSPPFFFSHHNSSPSLWRDRPAPLRRALTSPLTYPQPVPHSPVMRKGGRDDTHLRLVPPRLALPSLAFRRGDHYPLPGTTRPAARATPSHPALPLLAPLSYPSLGLALVSSLPAPQPTCSRASYARLPWSPSHASLSCLPSHNMAVTLPHPVA
ncbi:hypothetical protein Efla_000148 [Eimeria flavescens]